MSQTKAQLIDNLVQPITGALGSAAAPTFSFTADPNTGVYSPGADQVAISTGGTGRLFVDASGNIKVSTGEVSQTSASSFIRLDGGTGAGTGGNVIVFGELHGSAPGRVALTAVGTGAIIGSTGGVERLRITAAGFIGIGTSSPNYQLHVTTDFAVGASGFNQQLSFTNDTIQSLLLGTGYTALKLNPLGGNVGIGTSSPSAPLHLSTGSTAASALFASTDTTAYSATSFLSGARLRILGGSATNAYNGITFGNNNNAEGFIGFVQNISGYNDFVVQSYAGSYTEKLRVTSAGNVGIGTTSPQVDLQIGNADGSSRDIVVHTLNNGNARLRFREGGTIASGYNEYSFGMVGNANAMSWESQGLGELGRWDSSGKLLVGTSSQPNTGGKLCVSNGIGIVNTTSNTFATVEHGNGASGIFTTITISATVQNTATSVIFETLMTGFSGVYLDNVSGKYSGQTAVTMRNNASAGTSAALTVNGTTTIYTLTITTSVTHPVVKVKVTAGGLSGDITLPTIIFA